MPEDDDELGRPESDLFELEEDLAFEEPESELDFFDEDELPPPPEERSEEEEDRLLEEDDDRER